MSAPFVHRCRPSGGLASRHFHALLRWGACGLAMVLPMSGDFTISSTTDPTARRPVPIVTGPAPAMARAASLDGEKAIEHLKATGQYESLSAAVTAARYAVRAAPLHEPPSAGAPATAFGGPSEGPVHGSSLPRASSELVEASQTPAATAANPAHGLFSTFTPKGLRLRVRTSKAADAAVLTSEWRLESLGYGAEQTPVRAGELRVAGQRAEIIRGGSATPHSADRIPRLTEWFHNTPGGLEHGFTMHERPRFGVPPSGGSTPKPPEGGTPNHDAQALQHEQPLRLVMAVSGDLTPHADAAGQRLELRDVAGHVVLSYEKLKVWDATGVELSATMEAGEGQITLAVDDGTARYPLTIDPTFTRQGPLVSSYSTQPSDGYGGSLAISGDTVVIGAPYENSGATGVNGDPFNNRGWNSGAAYVFVRQSGVWIQEAYLKASNAQGGDPDTADDRRSGDFFGLSVAVSGDTVVVGAIFEDSNASGVNGPQSNNDAPDSGAAYVFVRNAGVWTQDAYLKASNPGVSDMFGRSVAVSENRIVVGAPCEDSAASWVHPNPNDNGARDSGAAYVFYRSDRVAGVWVLQAYLKPSNPKFLAFFGWSVAVEGDAVLVGAPGEGNDARTVDNSGINPTPESSNNDAPGSGAAYVFRSDTFGRWRQEAYLKASNARGDTTDGYYFGDAFGMSVALSGSTVVVGAPGQGAHSGAAYVFARNLSGTAWSEQAFLKASDPQGGWEFYPYGANFGGYVAVSGERFSEGDRLFVGGGGVYTFVRTGTTWVQDGYLNEVGKPSVSGNSLLVAGRPGPYVFEITETAPPPPSPGRIEVSLSPSETMNVGDNVTVTLSISGYTEANEIDGFNLYVQYPTRSFGTVFSMVPDSLRINDARVPNENWLRHAPQDGWGSAAALPLTASADDNPIIGLLHITVADRRSSSVRGTVADHGFLCSLALHAEAVVGGTITVVAPLDGSLLLNIPHPPPGVPPPGVPSFGSASVTVTERVPPPPGQITGRIDMLHETENAIPTSSTVSTWVGASEGPRGAGLAVVLPPPYYGGFVLDGLPASSFVVPDRGYQVGAALNIREGRRLETFVAPSLGQGVNDPVMVPAGGVANLGDTFVMDPGYVDGRLFLQGPTESLLGHACALRGIARFVDNDADHDGIPDGNPDGDSRVSAAGMSDRKSVGATYSAAGAKAFASFEGEFNPTTSAFLGDYELVLAGLAGQASYWERLGVQLLLRSGLPETPDTYVHEKLLVTERIAPNYRNSIEIVPGDHNDVDLNYCLSEVTLEVEVAPEEGTLFNPTVRVLNSGLNLSDVTATDFLGNIHSYAVGLVDTVGTPTVAGVDRHGRVVLLLPEGSYDLRVTAQVQSPLGEITAREFAFPSPSSSTARLKVGCGERLRVSPLELQVQIESASVCGPGELARVDGSVLAGPGINVRRIEWSTPGGEAHMLCDDLFTPCGSFSFDLPTPVDPCAGTPVTITAYTPEGRSVSLTRNVRDTVPPVITIGADKTVECGSAWEFDPATALDACSGIVPAEIVGTITTPIGPCSSTVDRTWRATDTCGNTSERTQRVTVVDTTPPTIIAPPNVTVECPQRVNFFVAMEDNCEGPITSTVTPPIGSLFRPGVTEVVATAVDACGLRTERRFTVTVLGACPMATSLGVPLMPLGNTMTDPRADGSLRLTGLGGSIADGLRLDPGEVSGLRVDFDQVQAAASLAPGSEFRVIALDAEGAPMALLRMLRHNSYELFELLPDFSGLNSSTFGIRLYSGTQLLYESRGRTAPPPNQFPISKQIFASVGPQLMRVFIRPTDGLVFEYHFGGPRGMAVYDDKGDVFPDRMEVFGDAAGLVRPAPLSGLDLRFSGVNERIITGVALMKFGQEFRASRGVALAGVGGSLAYFDLNVPPLTNPPPATAPVVWSVANPVGYFGDSIAGNPSGYKGYWEGMNPLGRAGHWDLKVDLTDNASAPLGWPKYRAGRSGAELTLAFIPSAPPLPPPFPDGAKLSVVAGGVADASPGALTVEMGALVFEGKAGQLELGAEFRSPTGPLRQRLEVTMADGTAQTFEGTEEELRVSWDQAGSLPTVAVTAAIGPDGMLSMGIRAVQPGPIMIHLPGDAGGQAASMTWTPRRPDQNPAGVLGGPQPLPRNPGSLRGLLLVGSNAPTVSITGLATSTDNPTPASFFADHQVSPLGHGTFRTDAFGSLALSGLTQSGEDGVAIKGFPVTVADAAWPSGPGLKLNPGYLPFWPQSYPPKGSRFDLRLLSEGNPVPNAVMAGQSINPGSAIFLGFQFPNLHGTNHTLRVFRGNSVVFNQSGRRNEAPPEQGNFIPDAIPDEVVARLVNGRFTWVLTWNRVITMSIYNQPFANPFLGDRAEIMADDGTAYPSGESTLELRAGSVGTLRLLNLGNRSAPSVPALNFSVNAGRLNLNWDEVVSGRPRLQTAPHVDGPWQNLTLGVRSDGAWDNRFELVPIGEDGYARLVTRSATEGCLDFSAETPGEHPNPEAFGGWKFDRFDPNNAHSPFNEIIELDGRRGLRFDGRMDLELPAPAQGVDVTFQRAGATVTFIAYDDAGEVYRKVVNPQPSSGGAQAETIEAPTRRPLRRLRLLGRDGPVDLRELCLRAFQFHDVAQARSCLPLRTAALGPTPNPWVQGDLTITAQTTNAAAPPTGLISLGNRDLVGYDVAYQAELTFAHACPRVEIEFLSNSGSIDFQTYDDAGTALPPYHLNRVSSFYGETAVFTANPRPIVRVVVTSPAGQTRLIKICGGPIPVPFDREVGNLTARPPRNPQPVGDMLWTFYDTAHVLAASTLHTNAAEVGLDLTPETVIDFASDQLSVELRVVVDDGGATLSVNALTEGGNTVTSLPGTSHAAGVRTLSLVDSCDCGVGARIRRVRVKLTAGNAMVTRVCTLFREEN